MRFRRSFLPRTGIDIGCFLLLFIFIPTTFLFEQMVVFPDFHEAGSFFYIFNCVGGCFVVFNLIGNLLACMVVDTSIKSLMLIPPTQPALKRLWHYCSLCEALVPPRAWHCQVCRTCILKRDHHCMFSGYCVGHYNYRYFMVFLFYVSIGTCYATIYNSMYFWRLHADVYATQSTLVKMVFPMMILVMDVSFENLYLLIYMLNMIGFAYTLILIIYHWSVLRYGAVCYERSAEKFDLGVCRNIEMVLGKNKWWVWLAPFVKSELPHDGVHWEEILQQSTKNR